MRELMKGWVYWYMCKHAWTHVNTCTLDIYHVVSKYPWIHEKGPHILGTRDILQDVVDSIHKGMIFHLPQRPLPRLLAKLTQACGVGGRTEQGWEGFALQASPQMVFSKPNLPALARPDVWGVMRICGKVIGESTRVRVKHGSRIKPLVISLILTRPWESKNSFLK